MNKIMRNILIIGLLLTLFSCNNETNKESNQNKDLIAENLWGNKIPISKIINESNSTLIVPFSTSYCGYCLIDGYYSEKNYIENNNNFGGNSFHQCLFNPQLDIYTFQKHFRWKSDILTYPVELYKYHEDGFPTIFGFKNGKQLFKEFHDYAKFNSLSVKLWDNKKNLIPTGEMHMATRFIYDNEIQAAVLIYPEKDTIPIAEIKSGEKWNNYICKKINQLTKENLNKHLMLKGDFTFKELSDFFKNTTCPVKFKNDSVKVGNYKFEYSKTGMYFTCPNPYNPHKYLVINIRNNNRLNERSNYLDYVFFQTKNNITKKILYGHFKKSDNCTWTFNENTSFSEIDKKQFCKQYCEIHQKHISQKTNKGDVFSALNKNDKVTEYTFGKDFCKFPDLTTDNEGNIWEAWEENGDINLAKIDMNGKYETYKIEQNTSDSYDPKLAVSNGKIWVFYLNNQDDYYRLYYKTFDSLRLSDEILFSLKEPYDVILPAIASKDNEITVSYSIWAANYRLLAYSKIKDNIKTEPNYVNVCDSKYTNNYINAWYPSICYDNNNDVWGAWNQHYPANFGVCGGKLNGKAQPITQSAKKMDDWEEGGYPCIFTDGNNKYVVWQSSDIWGLYKNTNTQKIKFAKYDDKTNKWSIGEEVSLSSKIFINETPSAVIDNNNKIWVVYSGRKKGNNFKWGIYLTSFFNNKWTKPKLISSKNMNARAPKIIVGKDKALWITWHSGTGNEMNIKVLKMKY